jgi:hypothetical protein
MKKFLALFLVALLGLTFVAAADTTTVVTNALGMVITKVTKADGSFTTTISTGTSVAVPVTYREGISVFTDTNAYPVTASATYSNAASIGDMLIGTFSNKVWVLTRKGVFTLVN